MKVIIILPTYNERENIGLLIDQLISIFQNMNHDMNILVVDDNSPDGTAELVEKYISAHNNVHLISGKKAGLGAAYMRGMNHALDKLGADAVLEMDADFSHKPDDVPRLIAALDQADFVIGSRYVSGGSIPNDWSIIRKLVSKWGNICARYIAGLYKIHDCTAGFRAIRASILRQINFEALKVEGYAFQVVLLHQAIIKNAVVCEIPVDFVDRVRGETKLGLSDIVEFIKNTWWIRLENSKTFIKFALVGGSGIIVNLGIFTILLNLGLHKFIASPISIQLSIISNFILNNFWTFKNRNSRANIALKGVRFNSVSILSLCLSYIIFVILCLVFPQINPKISQLIGIIPASLVNYFFNTYWTFSNSRDKA